MTNKSRIVQKTGSESSNRELSREKEREQLIRGLTIMSYINLGFVPFALLAVFIFQILSAEDNRGPAVWYLTLVNLINFLAIGMLWCGVCFATPVMAYAYVFLNATWVVLYAIVYLGLLMFGQKHTKALWTAFFMYWILNLATTATVNILIRRLERERRMLPVAMKRKYNILTKNGIPEDAPAAMVANFQTNQSANDDFRTLLFRESVRM